MSFDSFVIDTMEDTPYTSTEACTSRQSNINQKIASFRNILTSKAQRQKFLQLIDMINTNDADFTANAYITVFKCDMAFQEQTTAK